MSLLHVKNLNITINTPDGSLEVIRDLSFNVEKNERLGIVGESGCGKSVTALALMCLLPSEAEVTGQILLNGQDLLALNEKQICKVRGNRMAMIFQEPMTALNPLQSIGSQISETLILHKKLKKSAVLKQAEELMEKVGLSVQNFPLNLYPHHLSGGQRQRVMIAMAIACQPDLLIADEATTALDVTIQEQILDLIKELASQYGMALIMISHDLGVIAQTTQKVMVMYAGRILEKGKTLDVFHHMAHPYTYGLFAAVPKPGSSQLKTKKRLYTIPGQVPDFMEKIKGCRFAERCSFTTNLCRKLEPEKTVLKNDHNVWCFNPMSGSKGK